MFFVTHSTLRFLVPSDCRLAHPSGADSFSIPPFTDGGFHSLSWLSDKSSSTVMCQTTSLNQDWLQNYTAGSIVSYSHNFLSITCKQIIELILYFLILEKRRGPLLAYLYAPMIVMIVANVFMFVWSAFSFYQRSVESSQVTNVSRRFQRY
jgi:hypothetical protein